jgi:hypothetical protein
MTTEEINASLESMLANAKSKPFLNHLIKSYFPASNVARLLEAPKGEFKCVLTRVALESAKELSDENKLGVTGKDTTTYMSNLAYKTFEAWVLDKSKGGDKHIHWLLKTIKGDKPKPTNNNEVPKAPAFKQATFTLSDGNDLLSKLKADMESNGK